MLTIFVGGGLLKRPSKNAKLGDSEGKEKVTFSQVPNVSVSMLYSIVVGQLFNNVDFVVYFEEYCGHLDGESLVPTNNVARNINF